MRRNVKIALAVALAIVAAATAHAAKAHAAKAHAAPAGDYTQSQARSGHQVYAQHCAQCHGGDLHGNAGPPLAGSQFADNLRFSKMSGQQLYHFIKTQMPADAPGSLSAAQYRDVLAYLLSKNGYPAGAKPLSSHSIASVKLLPYPGGNPTATTGGGTSNSSN
jgi:mono/diheme cytochrome c family protein